MSEEWPNQEQWNNRKEFSKVMASELIERLQELIKQHGDLPVLVESPGGYIADVDSANVGTDSIIGHNVIAINGY